MKNVNRVLKRKYFDLLNNNITVDGDPVPVYTKYISNVINTPYYVIIRSVSNVDTSTKQSNNTNTSIQLAIYTKDTTANSGEACDTIADQIYEIIYPTPNPTMDLMPDFYSTVLRKENDYEPDAFQADNAIFINRFITFSHKILHMKTA